MFWKKIIKIWFLTVIVLNMRSLLIFALEAPLVRLGGDSGYFTQALLSSHTTPYAGYVALVWVVHFLGWGNIGVVFIQWLVSLIAGVLLYRLTISITGNRVISKTIALYFITNYELMKWNFFILSDSFFISFVIISAWAITKYSKVKAFFLGSGLICLYSSIIRPNGFILFLSWLLFVFVPELRTKNKSSTSNILLGLLMTGLFVFSFVFLTRSAGDRGIFLYATNGELIWSNRQWLISEAAENVNTENSVTGVLVYAAKYPLLFLQLFFGKISVELFRVRPYLPLSYNIFLLINLIPFYILSTYGAIHKLASLRPYLFITICQMGLVGLTYADWDGRFLAYVFPLILVMASMGLKVLLLRYNKTNENIN
jgi:hypothetical protein